MTPFKTREEDLEYLIRQRFLIKKYTPDELYSIFNSFGLDFSLNEVCMMHSKLTTQELDIYPLEDLK
jgi:hypothetical protein